jgi:DNA-binding PadR family transcriptional regulator
MNFYKILVLMEFIYPYTLEYYNAIIDILEKKGKMTFNKLFEEWVKVLRQTKIKSKKHMKSKHSKPTKYTPSKSQLSDILTKMADDTYLTKLVDEKSKRMLKETKYELTEDARKLLQINILRIEDKQTIFKRIYEKILFYDFFKRVHTRVLQVLQQPGFLRIQETSMLFPDRTVKEITIDSEHEFNNFLSKIDIEHDQLNWGTTADGYSSGIERIIYPHNNPLKYLQKLKKQYWKENDHQLNKHERVWLICFPMNDNYNF